MVDLSVLQEHGVKGYVRFSIKAKDTKNNKAIHSDFKAFAEMVCSGDYTLALGTLMRSYEDRGMFEAMWDKLKEIEAKVEEIKTVPEEIEEVENEAF